MAGGDAGGEVLQLIEAYGDGGFRVSGTHHAGSILITPETTFAWPVAEPAEISFTSLAPIVGGDNPVDILLFGGGRSLSPVPDDLRARLREAGIVAEPMDTGAACRTYNVLMSEDRRVAAALIAVE